MSEDSIRVLIRVRPKLGGDDDRIDRSNSNNNSNVSVDVANGSVSIPRGEKKGISEFKYSSVLGASATQEDVYAKCSDIIDDSLNGINCCIMAYGQTSSGKTHTMLGKGWEEALFSGSQRLNLNASGVLSKSMDGKMLLKEKEKEKERKAPLQDPTPEGSDVGSDSEGSAATPCANPLGAAATVFTAPSTAPDSPTRPPRPAKDNYAGIIPRTMGDLFAQLARFQESTAHSSFTVHCQFMQIYNEKIYDLLQDKARTNPLQIRETGAGNGLDSRAERDSVHVRGLSESAVHSKEDVLALVKKGLRNRAQRGTDYNSESSRSHAILQLLIATEAPDEYTGLLCTKRATLSLVDLAGSEKWITTAIAEQNANSINAGTNASAVGIRDSMEGSLAAGIADGETATNTSMSSGVTVLDHAISNSNAEAAQKELVSINTSLHVLGNCVSALIEPGRKHIPFRDSSLTRLLQDSLGGSGRTVLIATIHEAGCYKDETYSTCQFAARASKIKVVVNPHVSVTDQNISLDLAKRQIAALKVKLQEALAASAGAGAGLGLGSVGGSRLNSSQGERSLPSIQQQTAAVAPDPAVAKALNELKELNETHMSLLAQPVRVDTCTNNEDMLKQKLSEMFKENSLLKKQIQEMQQSQEQIQQRPQQPTRRMSSKVAPNDGQQLRLSDDITMNTGTLPHILNQDNGKGLRGSIGDDGSLSSLENSVTSLSKGRGNGANKVKGRSKTPGQSGKIKLKPRAAEAAPGPRRAGSMAGRASAMPAITAAGTHTKKAVAGSTKLKQSSSAPGIGGRGAPTGATTRVAGQVRVSMSSPIRHRSSPLKGVVPPKQPTKSSPKRSNYSPISKVRKGAQKGAGGANVTALESLERRSDGSLSSLRSSQDAGVVPVRFSSPGAGAKTSRGVSFDVDDVDSRANYVPSGVTFGVSWDGGVSGGGGLSGFGSEPSNAALASYLALKKAEVGPSGGDNGGGGIPTASKGKGAGKTGVTVTDDILSGEAPSSPGNGYADRLLNGATVSGAPDSRGYDSSFGLSNPGTSVQPHLLPSSASGLAGGAGVARANYQDALSAASAALSTSASGSYNMQMETAMSDSNTVPISSSNLYNTSYANSNGNSLNNTGSYSNYQQYGGRDSSYDNSNGNSNSNRSFAAPYTGGTSASYATPSYNDRNSYQGNYGASGQSYTLGAGVSPAGATSVPVPVPVPVSSAPQGNNGGTCKKHGLDQCILCQMYGDSGGSSTGGGGGSSAYTAPSYSYTSSAGANNGSVAGGSSYDGTSGYLSTGPYGGASAGSSPKAADSLGNTGTYSVGLISRPTVPASSSSSLPTPVSGVCGAHGVTDCLLCAMRAQAQPTYGAVGGSPSLGASPPHSYGGGSYGSSAGMAGSVGLGGGIPRAPLSASGSGAPPMRVGSATGTSTATGSLVAPSGTPGRGITGAGADTSEFHTHPRATDAGLSPGPPYLTMSTQASPHLNSNAHTQLEVEAEVAQLQTKMGPTRVSPTKASVELEMKGVTAYSK